MPQHQREMNHTAYQSQVVSAVRCLRQRVLRSLRVVQHAAHGFESWHRVRTTGGLCLSLCDCCQWRDHLLSEDDDR